MGIPLVIFGQGYGLKLFLATLKPTWKLGRTSTFFQVHTELVFPANILTAVGAVKNETPEEKLCNEYTCSART